MVSAIPAVRLINWKRSRVLIFFPDDARFREIIKDVGVAIIGQTSSLAPADKRFYATRDITATVDSIPLITASILAKKLAEGLDALVMDVKVGSGAFMPTYELSEALAEAIVGVSNGAGVRTTALLTDMNRCWPPARVTPLKFAKRYSS